MFDLQNLPASARAEIYFGAVGSTSRNPFPVRKPRAASWLYIVVQAPGAGGGGGASGSAGVARRGGGGGASGARKTGFMPADALPTVMYVMAGSSSVGGASGVSALQSSRGGGLTRVNGVESNPIFGVGGVSNGGAATGTGGTGTAPTLNDSILVAVSSWHSGTAGLPSLASNAGSAGSFPGTASPTGLSTGGAGGGSTSTSGDFAGGGVTSFAPLLLPSRAGGAAGGGRGEDGQNYWIEVCGVMVPAYSIAGAGGGSFAAGTGGAGGAGGYGCGGGGGGAGTTGGAGGNGGPGWVLLIWLF